MSAVAQRTAAPTVARLALAARAAELRAAGLLYAEIAEELGISRSYASTLATDPDGSQQLARRARYHGTCERCGAQTDGSGGRTNAPKHCATCAPDANRTWTRDRIIDAIRRWNREYGCPPKSTDWNNAGRPDSYPATTSVYRTSTNPGAPFATWADAIEAAGFSRPLVGKRDGQRHWSPELIVEEMRSQSVLGVASGSTELYRVAAYYFGSWPAACAAAGLRPASECRARAPEAMPTRKGTGS